MSTSARFFALAWDESASALVPRTVLDAVFALTGGGAGDAVAGGLPAASLACGGCLGAGLGSTGGCVIEKGR